MSDITQISESLGEAVGRLAFLIGREREAGGLSPGDLAELRRMKPLGSTLPAACWRLLVGELSDAVVAYGGDIRAERAFAILIAAMAETGGNGPLPIGTALAETGYAEPRLVHLLRARGPEEVVFEARQAARWCRVQGVRPAFGGVDRPNGFAAFILAAALLRSEEADRRGQAIARDYYRTLARHERADTRQDTTP